MKQRIEVRSQDEFDACVSAGNIAIVIGCSVEARDSAHVVAWGSAHVVAWGSVFIRLFSAMSIKASAYVTIVKHGDAPGTITGGNVLPAAPEPITGAEWSEYYGIDQSAPFRVENIDAAILDAIEHDKSKGLDMGSWHGGDVCDETNWCNTTHCRAGFAIGLAGKPGFDLAKKYGDEVAGRMIYAVSRPDKPLPDFHASTLAAMKDIKESAASAVTIREPTP